MWVAGGRGTNSIAYSTDGISWTGIGNDDISEVYVVKNVNGVWYAGGNNGLKRSANGISWFYEGTVEGSDSKILCLSGKLSGVYSYSNNNIMPNTITFPESKYIAIGNDRSKRILYSTDSINWNGGSTIFSNESIFTATNGSIYIAVGDGVKNTLAYSYDGLIWNGLGKTIFTTKGNMVAYRSGLWVAVGEGTNTIATSTDGINWTGLGTTVFSSY